MTREQKQEFTLRISQANPTELVVILYEMLLCYLQESREALDREDEREFREALRKARGCLGELMNSLNLKYQPAPALLSLCGFCVRRLTTAELKKARRRWRRRSVSSGLFGTPTGRLRDRTARARS